MVQNGLAFVRSGAVRVHSYGSWGSGKKGIGAVFWGEGATGTGTGTGKAREVEKACTVECDACDNVMLWLAVEKRSPP